MTLSVPSNKLCSKYLTMASTSIQIVPSSFTSAFSKPQPEYDVFLSFRGETRCKFTDHLYHALVDRKIITFRDDKELELGESIKLELLEAIEKSRIAVIIFSKNYASSTWCLEELAKIVECRDRGILTVLPIFYHVEPTDVRHQTNTFKGAFAKHEKRFKENPIKVQKWRAALANVADLSGECLKDGVHEANFIRSIVQWIYSKLKEKHSNDIEDDLVGISSRVEEMISYLDLESTDVHFIGICEKSGMGKTTLARAVFDKIRNQFEACSFLENVREESKAHGLKTLQERLLCDIGKGGLRVKDVHKGMQVISDIPHNKKVLIVVDDVSEKSQLETLVGKRDLFGNGSRIIVTTEDKDLLEDKNLLASNEIKIVYEARGLDKVEALQLFSLNAFHKPYCENDFLEYCNNFVEYAKGIPLVLKVLGSYLCTRTKNEWESAQNQLREIPHEKTTKKLRIAFDGLGADEKKLFLDIACFFKGEEKNRVADILESVYFLDINLKNLIDKSLITLVGGKKLWMHNLLQQMGWEIVSEESEEARERSRLWRCDDVFDVLKNNTGTKHIEGMLLRFPPDEEEELNAESFSKMNKLRLLKICKVRLSCLSYLSNELCLLEWHDYPLESLPNSFQPGELVELIMHRSCLQQLPSEFSKLGKLKLIDLSDSQNLTRTPDFTRFSNIERLNFQGCTRLHELHPSVGGLKRLILLNLKDCKCLKNLPYELNLESLKTLILSGCSRFKKFPRIGRNMRSLLELYLDGTAIEELPPTIRRLTGLTLLNLRDCKNLKSFPSDVHSLTSLEILTLAGCKCQPPKAGHLLGLSHIGSSIGATLTFPRPISFLFLSFLACQYTYLRIPICATTALSTYCFRNARHPEPEPINLLSNLFSKLSTLVSLDLSDCNLLALPDDLSCFSSIKSLNLSKNNFIHFPDCISQLSKLKILFLDHCSKLKSLPHVPLSARFVSVQGCTSLENYSNQVVVWTSRVAGFTIITCLGLVEDEDGTVAEVSLLDIHPLWQRYVKDQIHQMEGFCHVLPQTEIPEWFEHQRFGSFRPIPLPSNLFSNKNWKGIALCVIFVVPAQLNDVSPGEDTKYFHEFYCRLDINGDLIAFKVPKETYVGSFGLWLYISHARFRKHLDERSCITPLIGTNSPDIEIKMCGARILYKLDMGEFLQNLGQKIFESPNDLRGELKSQLSRFNQVDWTRNHLSDYIFPQNASPPRSFAYQNGPAIKSQLPADLHDYSRWRPTPVTKHLPSNETIQGKCTSRETIFSNQVIAAGTSKSSRQGSIYLGKISSSLECWFNHGPYLQDHYEGPGTHNQCLPQSEIPGWFKSENIARSSSVTIELPLNLYDNLEWMGFAFCAVFSFQKHPTSVPMKGSEFSFFIVCHLKTDLGCMNPLYSISEEDVILSLHQRGFLWLSFIPCWVLSPEWSRCTSVEFSFVSDSSAVSALKCGVDLVYRQKLEFTRRMVQCITSYDGPLTSYERFRFYHPDQFSGSDGSSGASGHNSYDQFYKTAALPIADWEAHRSNSDLATRLRNNLDSSTSTPTPSRLKPAQPVKLDEVRVRVGSVTAGPSQGIKGARPPVLAPPPVAGRSVAVDYTSNWELLKSFAPLEDEVVAPNTTRLGGYAETTSSSSASSEEEDKKQNEGPLESTSNRNENETENENENENDIGIVCATNVIPVYGFSPRGKLRRSISSWQKGELLGSGSFGTVYEGYTEDGYFFAVKEVSLLDQGSQGKQNISYLEQEISLLKQFEHENIVQYLGTEKDESRIYIFLELVTKGSLASLYQKYRLRDSQVSAYTRQILNGLKYLHDKKVIHRDIKCSNILVDASGSVKLADFGLAKVTKLNDIKSCKGTPFWMAPEVVNLKNRFYGLAADIWSLGCTVLEMLTRQHPYSHLEGMQALFMIGKGKPPLVPDSLSRDARDFILKCLQVNPNDRPTATQLLDHPFVTRPQNSFGPASPYNSIQL